MRSISGKSRSPWMTEPAIPGDASPRRDVRTEVCVVGAGITGLSVAYLAARDGREVVVIDRGAIGDGDTARTTAHLTAVLDTRYEELERRRGVAATRLVAASHLAAIDRIESIVREHRIACDFRRVSAYLFAPPGRPQAELARERAAARRAGLREVDWVRRAPLGRFDTGRCLRYPNQAQFHPLRFLGGLVAAIRAHGGRVVTHAPAREIESGRPGHVTIAGGTTITADEIVVATHAPVHSRLAMHARQAAIRTYAIGVEIPRGSVAPALFYDTLEPYHYVRVHRPAHARRDLLIVGGEDHPTGSCNDAIRRWNTLEAWTRERFAVSRRATFRWSGQVFESTDGLACIGGDGSTRHLALATGMAGSGMTYAMIAAELLVDRWRRRANRATRLYDPARRLAAPKGRDGAGVARSAERDSEHAASRTPASIRRGRGAIVHLTGHAYAISRDARGRLTRRSARCTHLGCPVAWNSAEGSWDCTCHGSRFDRHGRVVAGPAIEDLRSVGGKERLRPRERRSAAIARPRRSGA